MQRLQPAIDKNFTKGIYNLQEPKTKTKEKSLTASGKTTKPHLKLGKAPWRKKIVHQSLQ